MHLDMIAVNVFRLIQFYDTLFELAILYRASGWGICTPIIWLSINICCRMVENVTFPPEKLLLKVLDYVNFMTHNLNLLSYIELVGGVFAPLLFVFYINLL